MLCPQQGSLDREVTLEFQEVQDRVLMVQVERMVFQVFLDLKAGLERFWGPLLEILEGMVYLDSQEKKVYLGRLELQDCPVGRETSCNNLKAEVVAFLTIFSFLR